MGNVARTSLNRQTSIQKPVVSSAKPQDMGLPKKLGIGTIVGAALGVFGQEGFIWQFLNLATGLVKCIDPKLEFRQKIGATSVALLQQWAVLSLIQNVLLTRMPKYLLKKFDPAKEAIIDSKIAKVVRAALVVALPLAVNRNFPIRYLVPVIGCSILQETKVGVPGVIAANIVGQAVAWINPLIKK